MTPQMAPSSGSLGAPGDAVIQPADIRGQLDRILASRTFRTAEGQQAFLKYAVGEVLAGRGSLVKEYLIGVEAFGRGDRFDPRLDPIVRTQARKLRARLAKYYETEGVSDPIRVEFPKGSYVPTFSRVVNVVDPVGEPLGDEELQETEQSTAPLPVQLSRHSLLGNRRNRLISALALVIMVLAGLVLYLAQRHSGQPALVAGSSLAVLPFVNLNGDSANEFLSDGLTDDLIESLGQVPGLRVVARTSAFRFKGKALSVQELGQRLNVHAILKGTVRTSGNSLRISAQLFNAADGHHLWSGSFEHDANDAGSMPRDISVEIASVLGSRLGLAGSESPALPSPTHDAYQEYLKGLYLWNKMSTGDLEMAIAFFQKAIAADPTFARAYTALADSYVMAPQVSTAAQMEIIPKIRAAANKALSLDASLGEAHIDLAICAEYDNDWPTAEREFKKGLELSPDNAVARLWYAKFLAIVGRRPEVLTQRKIAVELDPVSPYALQSVAGYLSVAGQYEAAIAQFRNTIALEPNFGLSHQGLGVAYVLAGRPAEGIAELRTACKLMPGPRREALLGWAYGFSGNAGEAQRILAGFLAEQSRNDSFPALAIAQVYIGLGDKDHAFVWLNKAADQKDLDMTLKWDSFYEPLRTDKRYAALLERLRLVSY